MGDVVVDADGEVVGAGTIQVVVNGFDHGGGELFG